MEGCEGDEEAEKDVWLCPGAKPLLSISPLSEAVVVERLVPDPLLILGIASRFLGGTFGGGMGIGEDLPHSLPLSAA